MKLITRDTDYAIRALLYMVKRNGSVSAAELTQELNIPKAFLRRILQVLGKRKILKSQKGKGGGFTLAAKPNKISLLKLIEIFQGRLMLSECTLKKEVCPDIKVCQVRNRIDQIQQYVISQLDDITLTSLQR